jgi:hypothetical protein
MTVVINRHATHIHAHLTSSQRRQVFQRTAQGAVNADGHGEVSGACDKARLMNGLKKLSTTMPSVYRSHPL